MTTLAEIESAVKTLPKDQKYALYRYLETELRSAPDQLPNPPPHSVLDIPPVSVGAVLRPLPSREELYDEMLEGRV